MVLNLIETKEDVSKNLPESSNVWNKREMFDNKDIKLLLTITVKINSLQTLITEKLTTPQTL